jgi:hypothetical protein
MGGTRNAFSIFGGELEGTRPLGTPRRTWEYNIRTNLREIGWKGVDWIRLDQDRDQWRDLVTRVLKL